MSSTYLNITMWSGMSSLSLKYYFTEKVHLLSFFLLEHPSTCELYWHHDLCAQWCWLAQIKDDSVIYQAHTWTEPCGLAYQVFVGFYWKSTPALFLPTRTPHYLRMIMTSWSQCPVMPTRPSLRWHWDMPNTYQNRTVWSGMSSKISKILLKNYTSTPPPHSNPYLPANDVDFLISMPSDADTQIKDNEGISQVHTWREPCGAPYLVNVQKYIIIPFDPELAMSTPTCDPFGTEPAYKISCFCAKWIISQNGHSQF